MATVSRGLPKRPHLDIREARELLDRWRQGEGDAFERIRHAQVKTFPPMVSSGKDNYQPGRPKSPVPQTSFFVGTMISTYKMLTSCKAENREDATGSYGVITPYF